MSSIIGPDTSNNEDLNGSHSIGETLACNDIIVLSFILSAAIVSV